MAGRKRPPADAAAAPGGTDLTDNQTASSSKTSARSPAQRPSRSRSQTTKAKAGANFGDGNGHGTISSSTTSTAEPTVSRTTDQPLSEAEVRARAYEIYLSRGGADGDPVADWLAAERQVLGKGSQTS